LAFVDQRIHEKVWGWLTAHPDIWVGKKREGNKLSFSEVLAESSTTPGSPRDVIQQLQQSVLEGQSQHANPSSTTTVERAVDETNDSTSGLRIYTTVGRMWQAVAGHAVDPKRIPDMEFKCLRIIAVAGPRGITQPDIVAITKQDKRSVPKRTDNLHESKYILKTPIYGKEGKTSLCVHRRYLQGGANQTKDVFSGGALLFDNFLDCLCEWLKDGKVMTLEELYQTMKAPEKSWRRDKLWRALERLDMIGIIQRFHITQENSNPITPAGRAAKPIRVNCIRLLKNPAAEDRKRYHGITVPYRNAFRRRLEAQDASVRAEHAENNGDDDYAAGPEESVAPEPTPTTTTNRYTGPIQWNPDIPHTNLLYNIVAESREAGLSTMVGIYSFLTSASF
jgi:hypothetical protein